MTHSIKNISLENWTTELRKEIINRETSTKKLEDLPQSMSLKLCLTAGNWKTIVI